MFDYPGITIAKQKGNNTRKLYQKKSKIIIPDLKFKEFTANDMFTEIISICLLNKSNQITSQITPFFSENSRRNVNFLLENIFGFI